MQIEELSRPSNTGYWCGSSWGHNVFYSETSSVSVMLRVFNLSDQVSQKPVKMINEENVLLEISYRYLVQEKAVLRYGVPYSPSYLGVDVPGSFCDRYLENCDKKNCKLQSPNYPGLYPRNLTCYYHVKQTLVPDGKVALIRVRQRNPHLIYIKDQNAPHLARETKFQLKDACHVLHDYLMIFDGNSTQDPVLLKACKGGALSAITSSGPDMLILFHVSPYDFPFQDSPRRRIFGFQLEVEVLMVGRESTAYVRLNNKSPQSALYPSVPASAPYSCQWEISSRGQRSGYVQAPAHSILQNTTCMWRLIAGPTEVVWLYFLHYRHVKHFEMPTPSHCPNTLTIYDGQFCKRDKFPRVCSGVHAPGTVGSTAPCPPSESYVSISPALTLKLKYEVGTIPAHIEFLARYEFVDQHQYGDPNVHGKECDRIFKLRPDRLFASPRNVFLFGRGGSRSLHCVYTFKVAQHERILLRIIRSKIGSICKTIYTDSSQRYECNHGGASNLPSIKLQETLWSTVQLTRACLCNISELNSFTIRSYTNVIELVLNIPSMSPAEDYNDYFFEGEYQVVEAKSELLCDMTEHQYGGKFGNFSVGSKKKDLCNALPHHVNAQDGAFLFIKIQGYSLLNRNCHATSRINVFAVGRPMPIASICPDASGESAYVFSDGWNERDRNRMLGLGASRDLVIEYTGNYSGEYLITWVGVWRPIHTAALSSAGADLCPHRCPEVEACLPPELWCDGTSHCPSEVDEGASACGILAALPWVSLGVGLALLVSLLVLLAAVMRHRKRSEEASKAVEVATVQNNGHGVKSATQELLLPLDKETTW
ncbi:UNVERIFIED_CONTAM: hypothetical protein GTU68_025901 [Idotea baltica]|nr:hypothetical protein [Idotea baltica]